ncbi:hypothetical protein MKW92_011612 [Papaver armeniacum]|nr:hypothetical protein MKW92_011612 [Papaver armeniacum]
MEIQVDMILRHELVLQVLVLFVSIPIFLSSRQCFPKGRSLLCPRTLVEAVHTLKERLWRIETQFPLTVHPNKVPWLLLKSIEQINRVIRAVVAGR